MVLSNLYLNGTQIMFINSTCTCKETLVLQGLNVLYGEKILICESSFLVEYVTYRHRILNKAVHTLYQHCQSHILTVRTDIKNGTKIVEVKIAFRKIRNFSCRILQALNQMLPEFERSMCIFKPSSVIAWPEVMSHWSKQGSSFTQYRKGQEGDKEREEGCKARRGRAPQTAVHVGPLPRRLAYRTNQGSYQNPTAADVH